MSFFNKDILCLKCLDIEAKHPLYKVAVDIERVHCKAEDFNYEGIGLPDDLIRYYRDFYGKF